MSVVLTQLIARLFMPVGLIWFVLAIVIVVSLVKHRLWMLLVSSVLFLFISVAGNLYFSQALVRTLEKEYSTFRISNIKEPLDAVFVLGGGVRYRADGYSFLGLAGDRVALAARLYEEGKVKMLVGVANHFGGGLSDVGNIWKSLGIPSDVIMTVNGAINTTDEMHKFAALEEQYHWKRVGLITSAWHLPRAMRLAEKQNLHFIPLPADFRGYTTSGSFSIIPTARALYYTETAVWEYLGRLVGR